MLNLTPKEVSKRSALRINPLKTCQPVGAMYAALGVHGCMPHSHGSQGCCSYHRTFLTRHFKDPAVASSSSFTEGASVFGGGANLKTAVRNIFDIYDPDIIAVHTTCLSETIGDDLTGYIQDAKIPDGKYVVHTNTPSYVGSHITGYANMISGFIKYLSEKTGETNGKIAVFPGFVNPGDMREMKRIMKLMGIPFTMLPDSSGVMDAPMTGTYHMFPQGGTTVAEIIDLGNCQSALALGEMTSETPAETLEKKCKVPYQTLALPIGIENTDAFIMALNHFSEQDVPDALEEERGQLLDIMLDSNQYSHDKTAAIYGDPDTVLGITQFVLEMGMIPKYVVTGTPGSTFEKRATELFEKYHVEGCVVKSAADLFELHQWLKNDPVDVMIGGTYGKAVARAEDIPLVRAGFPIIDRYVHSYLPIVGYKGAMRLLELILTAIMDRQDRDCADEDLEIVM
jgi:nitrogenase molybdenum-iron protein beta chain